MASDPVYQCGVSQRIDRFIHAMFKKQADQLLFGTGTPVRIRKDGQERVILDKEVRTEQILKLLGPISGGRDAELARDGEVRFTYNSPDGAVQVQTTIQEGRMLSVIVPAQAAAVAVDDDAPLDIMGNMAPEPVAAPSAPAPGAGAATGAGAGPSAGPSRAAAGREPIVHQPRWRAGDQPCAQRAL